MSEREIKNLLEDIYDAQKKSCHSAKLRKHGRLKAR